MDVEIRVWNQSTETVGGNITIHFTHGGKEQVNETISFSTPQSWQSSVDIYQKGGLSVGGMLQVTIALANGTAVTHTSSPWTADYLYITFYSNKIEFSEATT